MSFLCNIHEASHRALVLCLVYRVQCGHETKPKSVGQHEILLPHIHNPHLPELSWHLRNARITARDLLGSMPNSRRMQADLERPWRRGQKEGKTMENDGKRAIASHPKPLALLTTSPRRPRSPWSSRRTRFVARNRFQKVKRRAKTDLHHVFQPHEVPQRRVARCPRAESLAHPADPRESSPLAEAKGFLSLSSTTLALKRQDRWQGKQDIPPQEAQGA